MEFKDFFKLLSPNLDLGSNREERMRNLLSLVCEADPGFEGTEDDPVMAPPAASLNHIASGNRPFNSDIAEPILRHNFEPYGLVATLQERSQPQLERMAEAIRPFEPSITWERVPEWCADYFTRVLTAATTNQQLVEDAREKVRRIQTVAAHKRLGSALQMEAGSTCPALNCMNQLLQVNDQGVAVPSFEVTVIDPADDPRDSANLIALCPHHHAMHTGANPQAVQELKAIKDRLVSQFKSRWPCLHKAWSSGYGKCWRRWAALDKAICINRSQNHWRSKQKSQMTSCCSRLYWHTSLCGTSSSNRR